MGRLGQIIMAQKPLTPAELSKVKANQAIQQAKRKEEQVKRATGADKVEKEVEREVGHTDNLGDAVHASLPPSLLAKISRNEKLSPAEQKELANFFKSVGWL